MSRIGIQLHPVDTLFFRDGRPFDAADRVSGDLPGPQPLAGAIRTAVLAGLGFDFHKLSQKRHGRSQGNSDQEPAMNTKDAIAELLGNNWDWYQHLKIRGPWLAITNGDETIPLLKVPANLVRDAKSGASGEWRRSAPIDSVPGWSHVAEKVKNDCDVSNWWPLWRQEFQDASNPGGYLTLEAIKHYLNDDDERITDDEWFQQEDLYGFDARVGIKVDPETLTAEDSFIYAIRMLALQPKLKRQWAKRTQTDKDGKATEKYRDYSVCLFAEVEVPDAAPSQIPDWLGEPMPFGGEGRYVQPSVIAEPVDWPQGDLSNGDKQFRLLTTPGIFGSKKKAWMPDAIDQTDLCAAACDGGVAVSGWDVALNGPKPTRFAVPAGAVYYTNTPVSQDGDLHQSLCGDEEDIAQGWGLALTGVWKGLKDEQ